MNGASLLKPAGDGGGGGGASARLGFPTAAKLGLRLFMGVVTVLFSLLVLAYLSRSRLGDWQSLAGEPWLPLSNTKGLWLNTVMLMVSSVALQWARVAARRGDAGGTTMGLALGGFFAIAFLLGQLWVWQHLRGLGYFVASNPANSFFYLLTGLHGLHLVGGLVAWGRTAARMWRGAHAQQVRASVELCAVYWHFLLVVWLMLFGLLVSPRETLGTIAAICGF